MSARVLPSDPPSAGSVGPTVFFLLPLVSHLLRNHQIREKFRPFGQIDNVRIVRDKASGVGKGFGYVQFRNASAIDRGIFPRQAIAPLRPPACPPLPCLIEPQRGGVRVA